MHKKCFCLLAAIAAMTLCSAFLAPGLANAQADGFEEQFADPELPG